MRTDVVASSRCSMQAVKKVLETITRPPTNPVGAHALQLPTRHASYAGRHRVWRPNWAEIRAGQLSHASRSVRANLNICAMACGQSTSSPLSCARRTLLWLRLDYFVDGTRLQHGESINFAAPYSVNAAQATDTQKPRSHPCELKDNFH